MDAKVGDFGALKNAPPARFRLHKVAGLAVAGEYIHLWLRGFIWLAVTQHLDSFRRKGDSLRGSVLGVRDAPFVTLETDLIPFHSENVGLPGTGQQRQNHIVADSLVRLIGQRLKESRQFVWLNETVAGLQLEFFDPGSGVLLPEC